MKYYGIWARVDTIGLIRFVAKGEDEKHKILIDIFDKMDKSASVKIIEISKKEYEERYELL